MKHTFLMTQRSFLRDTENFTCIDGSTLHIGDITRWCQDNLKTWRGFWNYQSEYVIEVDNIDEAVAFKLRWA